MGGAIGFTIRENNGTEHRMCRWTNMTPWAVDNIGIIKQNKEHISEVLKGWYDMKNDYEKYGDSPESPSPMASCYVPYGALNPVEYGLIVVDFKTKHVLELNGYHRFGEFFSLNMKHEMTMQWAKPTPVTKKPRQVGLHAFKRKDTDCWRFRELWEAKKISGFYASRNDDDEFFKFSKSKYPTLKEIGSLITKGGIGFFKIDFSPMTLIRFEESAKGCKEFLAKVEELGFKLNDEEYQEWKGFTKRYR